MKVSRVIETTKPDESLAMFANDEGAHGYIFGVLALNDRADRYTVVPGECIGPAVVISLEIDNMYELYPDVTTYISDAVIPAPPPVGEHGEYDEEWVHVNILCWAGVGHTDGDSSYDVAVTACTDPALVATTFSAG